MTCLPALLAFLLPLACLAQPVKSNLHIKNAQPSYYLSADGKTLAVTANEFNQLPWLGLMDLTTNFWKPKASIYIHSLCVTPDLRSAYSNAYGLEGFKGNNEFQRYRKFTSWYHPDISSADKVQFPDQNLILAAKNDGVLLIATDVRLKKQQWGGPQVTARELSFYDPKEAKVIQTVYKGDEISISENWLKGKNTPRLIRNDSFLVEAYGQGWNVLNIYTGEQKRFNNLNSMYELDGGLCMFTQTISGARGLSLERKIADLVSGNYIYSDTIALVNGEGYWIAKSHSSNSFYTFYSATEKLYKEQFDGMRIVKKDSVSISFKQTLPNWTSLSRYDYQLMVSEPTGQILFLPYGDQTLYNRYSDQLFTWKLNTGELAFYTEKFVRPTEAWLAQQSEASRRRANYYAARNYTVAPNLWIRAQNGEIHYVLGKSGTGNLWDVNTYKLNAGKYSVYKQLKSDNELTYQCSTTSATTCNGCKGAGTTQSVSQRTTEKTDKMIYNEITTRKTENVYTTNGCTVCKGAGVIFQQQ